MIKRRTEYEMFSPASDRMVAKYVNSVIKMIERRKYTREQILEHLCKCLKEMNANPKIEEWGDTEPRNHIFDEIDKALIYVGYKRLTWDEFWKVCK